jgi:uncharacterized protein (TIGR04551 family)
LIRRLYAASPPVLARTLSAAALSLLLATPAFAQFGGQPGGMGPGMNPQSGDENKEEGPAEAAPDEETARPTDLEPLSGYPGQHRKVTRIVEIDGYFRVRTDFFHQLDLKQGYAMDSRVTAPGLRPPPFPQPIECLAQDNYTCNYHNTGGGNLRLRLEPTINVTDQVRVHTQVDVLDNTFMGSTPDSLISATRPGDRTGKAPLGALYTTQDPPEIGKNGYLSSIRAKRAWGEVDTEFGSLSFGRIPWHFGRGMTFNSGACQDCEGGTTVDRVMATTQIYGHQLALAWDWGAAGPNTAMTNLGKFDTDNPPLDLSQEDDVFELMASFQRFDDARKFRERIDVGEVAVNYGFQLVYRRQNSEVLDYQMSTTTQTAAKTMNGAPADTTLTRDNLSSSTSPTHVGATIFLPNLWFKLGWKILTVEAEAGAVLGTIDNGGPLVQGNASSATKLSLQSFGWVVATELRVYKDAFFLGFETGGATGDQAENLAAPLNYRYGVVQQPAGDTHIHNFQFNPDYQVDQILFRRLLGTVTNAVYFKPSLTYWLDLVETRQIGLSASLLYSMAPVMVSTPGNALSYGVEMDAGVSYRNPADGFFGGVTYGVLWPMGALDRGRITGGGAAGGFDKTDDAATAQVLRTFLGIRF